MGKRQCLILSLTRMETVILTRGESTLFHSMRLNGWTQTQMAWEITLTLTTTEMVLKTLQIPPRSIRFNAEIRMGMVATTVPREPTTLPLTGLTMTQTVSAISGTQTTIMTALPTTRPITAL